MMPCLLKSYNISIRPILTLIIIELLYKKEPVFSSKIIITEYIVVSQTWLQIRSPVLNPGVTATCLCFFQVLLLYYARTIQCGKLFFNRTTSRKRKGPVNTTFPWLSAIA